MEKLIEKFNNKKMLENLVIFLILAVIVMIVLNSIFDSKEELETTINNPSFTEIRAMNTEVTLEEKLAHILSSISGAGKVEVMISYKNEIQKVPMTDIKTTTTVTNERDSSGGERKTEQTSTEENVIYSETGSNKTPVMKQSILPEIIGVVVVAEGASNANVKENLLKAVEATIDVPSHRIQVFPKS